MEISGLFNRKLRYCISLILSHSFTNLPSLPKTLLSLKPFLIHSSHFLTDFSSYSSFSTLDSPQRICKESTDSSSVMRCNNLIFKTSRIGFSRNYSSQCQKSGTDASPIRVSDIVELIKSNGDNLDSKLNATSCRLSVSLITEVFQVLNRDRVSGLHFYSWIEHQQPMFYWNSSVCNLVIDHCGRLGDFVEMHKFLLCAGKIHLNLTERAFGFISVIIRDSSGSEESVWESVWKVVEILKNVGGSCFATGVPALIKTLCMSSSLEMAKQLINELAMKKPIYYDILIKEMSVRFDFEGATGMLEEMRRMGCDPTPRTYCYILSNMCKADKLDLALTLMEEMQKSNCIPDALVFEILVLYFCRKNKLDSAFDVLETMDTKGIVPRLSTHNIIIKTCFHLEKVDMAYDYVTRSSEKYRCSSNSSYSLLAELHYSKRNLIAAENIITEMMNKGLRPSFTVYTRVLRGLKKSGKKDLRELDR